MYVFLNTFINIFMNRNTCEYKSQSSEEPITEN